MRQVAINTGWTDRQYNSCIAGSNDLYEVPISTQQIIIGQQDHGLIQQQYSLP